MSGRRGLAGDTVKPPLVDINDISMTYVIMLVVGVVVVGVAVAVHHVVAGEADMALASSAVTREGDMALASSTVAGESIVSLRPVFSADGRSLAVPCGHGVSVYSTETGECVVEMHHHRDAVTGAVLGRNRLQLWSSSLDGRMILSDYSDGGLLRAIDFEVPILQFGIRPGNQEPSVFMTVARDKEESLLPKLRSESETTVVALPSSVLYDRCSTPSPNAQLTSATALFLVGQQPNELVFSSNGEYVATHSGKKLLVYLIEAEQLFKYSCPYLLTSIAFHPIKKCIATGDDQGQIFIWYNFAQSSSHVVKKKLHWHAHAVADLCFTSDGTYLLSGGEEATLVLWQMDKEGKDYRPRLGAPILRLTCSPNDALFGVSLQNNVIHLISGLTNNVECTLGSLRKTLPQQHEKDGAPVRTRLVCQPASASTIVLNGSPGHLQFFDVDKNCLSHELEIVPLNVVSRQNEEPLTLTTVKHAAFSPKGTWLATIDSWDNGLVAAERKLKFWWFDSTRQCYTLNTSVDPPHQDTVTSLSFSPVLGPPVNSQSDQLSTVVAVTTSLDKCFKIWVSIETERNREKEEVKDDKSGFATTWACRSVGYYHNLPCYGSAFSEDGSLIAINFSKYITVWDPLTCELREVFNSPEQSDRFTGVVFGHQSSSHYLIATSYRHLHVWDLLTCSVVWSVPVSPDVLVADSHSSTAAVFIPSPASSDSADLYLFDPASSNPLAVIKNVCPSPVAGAVFLPNTSPEGTEEDERIAGICSRLFFMDKAQLLYTVTDEENTQRRTIVNELKITKNRQQSSLFHEIFSSSYKNKAGDQDTMDTHSSNRPSWKGFNAAPHVLPPMSLYCEKILASFLSGDHEKMSKFETEDSSDSEDEQAEEGSAHSESEEEEKRSSAIALDDDTQTSAMDVDKREAGGRLREKVGKFDWLVGFFRTDMFK